MQDVWEPRAEEVSPKSPEDQLPHETRALHPLRQIRAISTDAGAVPTMMYYMQLCSTSTYYPHSLTLGAHAQRGLQ